MPGLAGSGVQFFSTIDVQTMDEGLEVYRP